MTSQVTNDHPITISSESKNGPSRAEWIGRIWQKGSKIAPAALAIFNFVLLGGGFFIGGLEGGLIASLGALNSIVHLNSAMSIHITQKVKKLAKQLQATTNELKATITGYENKITEMKTDEQSNSLKNQEQINKIQAITNELTVLHEEKKKQQEAFERTCKYYKDMVNVLTESTEVNSQQRKGMMHQKTAKFRTLLTAINSETASLQQTQQYNASIKAVLENNLFIWEQIEKEEESEIERLGENIKNIQLSSKEFTNSLERLELQQKAMENERIRLENAIKQAQEMGLIPTSSSSSISSP